MAHPQNSPRGLFGKKRVDVGSSQITYDSTGIVLSAGIKINNQKRITANSTAVTVAAPIIVNSNKTISSNSTGFIFSAAAAKPAARSAAKWAFLTNGTGVNGMAINVTGTTWKYVSLTSIQITS